MSSQAPTTLPRTELNLPSAFHQAATYHAQGRLWEAEQLYQVVLKADGRHFECLYRLGLIGLQQNKFFEAMQRFRRALKVNKNSADAQFHLGVALTGLGRADEAIRCYAKALTLKPRFAEAHNNLGHALQLLGRHQQALEHYQKALADQPGYAEARNNLGNALHMLGQCEAAIVEFEKLLAAKPAYAEARNNLGNVLWAVGRHQEAITEYETAIASSPNYGDAHYSLGRALAALGRHEESIVHYQAVIEARSDDADVYLNAGNALAALGRHEDAINHYDQALALRSDHPAALKARANALIRLSRDADTAQTLEALIKGGVCPIDVLLSLANLPAPVVSIDLLSQLEKVVRKEGDDSVQFDTFAGFVRATALHQAGRHAEAWKELRSANRTVFLAGQEQFANELERERRSLAGLRECTGQGSAGNGEGPISLFILGPSRSGKTTMEELVSTLDGVRRGFEHPGVENALRRTCRAAGIPDVSLLENLSPTLYPTWRGMYVEDIATRAESAKVLANTNPVRIHDAHLLVDALGGVRLLFIKRNLEDTLLRMYLRRYNNGNIYAYDLRAARDHIIWYYEMMDLLLQKFPRIGRAVHYEDMIGDPAGALRAVADLCGLPMPAAPLPALKDDRGCAAPYRHLLAAELEG